MFVISVGEKIKEIRKSKNMSARELSRRSKVSQGYLSQLETGKNNNPTNEVLRKIAKGFNMSYVVFMTELGYVNEDGAVPIDSFSDMTQPSSASKMKQGAMIASDGKREFVLNGMDLHVELTKEQKVFYKDALLSDNDKQKIDAMIKVMIDKESN